MRDTETTKEELPGKNIMELSYFKNGNYEFKMTEEYLVYALIKNHKPIYVGCSSNLKRRAMDHGYNFDFDRVIILKRGMAKQKALNKEREFTILLSEFFDLANILGNDKKIHKNTKTIKP